ncbi:hypothetical protein OEZ85_012768 [Tetradesmus obliquus]|uniref:Uncharacterized protein n=1 Tax=Tetradesmus obliquus TaxID=3088 RepID=A0ABY8U4L4_TETOB|nr:hypothetical protein OEZ85_012768 [Tetradesmus obliquus]
MGYTMSYKHRMQAAACCFLLLAAAATVQTANAAGPDSFVGSLAGHVQVRDAWHAAAPISSAWMHVPDSTLSAEATSTAAAAAAATIEIGQLSSDAAQRRMMLAQTAAPPAAAAAAQKCKDYSKDMNKHTKDGYKLRWKAFADSCSAACRKQSVVKVPDGVYKVYCEVQSCSCTLVNESTKKKYGGVKLEYAATRASDGAFVAAFFVKGELYPTAKACEKCAGPYSFCRNC